VLVNGATVPLPMNEALWTFTDESRRLLAAASLPPSCKFYKCASAPALRVPTMPVTHDLFAANLDVPWLLQQAWLKGTICPQMTCALGLLAACMAAGWPRGGRWYMARSRCR